MVSVESIKRAASAATAHGYALSPEVAKAVEDIASPVYRVAVVGKYQVGKSALINRVFLGNRPLLTEGRGLCTTAVSTDIEYGDAPKLEVYNWADSAHASDMLVKTVLDPTAEDANAATVSSDMSTRAELAGRVSRVSIKIPNESLRNYTVIDTPGLDDPEDDLLANTTYRIVPLADVALLVMEPKQLDAIELKFLRNELIGRNGISRLLLMVSYNPPKHDLDEDARERIVETIRAQLGNIGREDIEVHMYCYDSSIEDIMSDVAEIRMTIRTFLDVNALPGRVEKISALLRNELETIEVQIATQLKLAGASEAEIALAQQRLEEEVVRFKSRCEREFEGLKMEFCSIRDQMYNDVDMAVDGVFERFYAQLESAANLSGMKSICERAESILKGDLQEKISVVGLKLKAQIERALEGYSSRIADVQSSWNLYLSNEFGVKRPLVTKIPSLVWDVIDVGILNYILPGGFIVAIVAHLFGKGIVDPAKWVAQKLGLSQMKKALDESKGDVRQRIMDQVAENLTKSFEGIKNAIEVANKSQVEAIRDGMKSGQGSTPSVNRTELESAKAEIEAALADL